MRGLLDGYLSARTALKEAGVLKSDRTIQSDYAEWLVARRLHLRLMQSSVQAGYDAVDARGRTYQVKARVVRSLAATTSFDFRSFEHSFDFLVGVFLDDQLNLLGMIKVPFSVVAEISQSNKGSRRLRWNRTTAQDSRFERLYWQESESR